MTNQVLFVADGGFRDMITIQKLVLDQPEVLEFEWNQNKSGPSQKGIAAFRADMKKRKAEEKMQKKKKQAEGASPGGQATESNVQGGGAKEL